jgi:hypothetical protein
MVWVHRALTAESVEAQARAELERRTASGSRFRS